MSTLQKDDHNSFNEEISPMNADRSVAADIPDDVLEEYFEAFELFDKDGDGTISTGELKNLLRCFDVDLPDDEVIKII